MNKEYTDFEKISEAFDLAADIIQIQKHAAQATTAQSANDGDWDLEAYYRAKAEGLAQAEKVLREKADQLRKLEKATS